MVLAGEKVEVGDQGGIGKERLDGESQQLLSEATWHPKNGLC